MCGVCRKRRSDAYTLRRRREDPARYLYEQAKARAKKSGVAFTITVEDVRAVWPQDGNCPVFGEPLTTSAYGTGSRRGFWSPSLDRINNAWGYTPDNIAIISWRANNLKRDATAAELEQIATWMRGRGLA